MMKANKLIALLLTAAMLLTIVPAQVFAEESNGQQVKFITEEKSTERKSPVVTELTEERDKYTKVYLHADGTMTAFVSGEPLHYEQDGEWLDIDNTLQAASVNGREILTNTNNGYRVDLPKELDSSSEIKISSGDHSLSFSMNDMEGTAEARQEASPMPVAAEEENPLAKTTVREYAEEELENKVSKITYPSVSPNVDIEYTVHPEQLKENIILNEKPAAGAVFSFHIDAAGLNGVKNADSSVSFLSGTEEIFRVAAPFMFDSAGAYSSEIEVTLTPDGNGGYTLAYAPSEAWLADAGRAYPVTIDPYITSPDGIWDYAGVQQQNPAVNYGGMAPTIGKTVSGGNTYESYAYFKANGITVPYNGKILKSEFHVGGYKGAGSGVSSVSLYEVTSAWDKGTITWNSQPTVSPVLTDYLPDSPAGAGDYSFNITKLVEKWTADPSANFGFMLKSGFTGSVNLIADAAGNTLPPVYMTIEYTDPNRALDDDGYHIQDIGRAGKAYVNNQTGSLMVRRTDLQFDGNRAPAEFTMIYNSANTNENTYGRGWNNQYDEVIQYLNNTVMGEMFWIDRGDGTRQYFDKYIPGPDDETGESGTPVMTPLGGTASTTASDGLRVRSGPGTSYSILGTLSLNTTVRLLGWYESINWYKVQYGTGVGYVIGDYLTGFSKIPMTEIYGTAVYSDTGNLNVRMGPDTGYNLLGTISSGSEVTLLGSYSNGWYQIDYNGSAGCITGQYLTGVSTAELTAVYGTAQVSATDNLNVRSAPTTSAAVLGRLSYETEVDLLGYYQIGETKWYKIIYNDGYGYVSGDWLKNIKDGYNFIDRMSGEKVKLTSADGELTPSASSYTLTYEDETVKEYTNKRLTKITVGNEHASTKSSISLNVSGTLINSITDGAGRVYQISRYRGQTTSASYKGTGDTALRQASYTYSGGYLTKVTYPDGLSVNYTWTDGNLTKITDVDGYSINYEYTGGRVTKITETASDGTVGESISISYGNKSTVYTDTQGHQEIINFDNYGNVISMHDDKGNAVFSEYSKKNTQRNKLTGISSIRRATINLANNSGFENSNQNYPLSSNDTNAIFNYAFSGSETISPYAGNHCLHVGKQSSMETVLFSTFMGTAGKEYTVSCWVYTSGNTENVKLQVSNGNIFESSESINTSGKWQRIEISCTAENAGAIEVDLILSGNGDYYFDNIQFEQAPYAGSYNCLENCDFSEEAQYWTGNNLERNDTVVNYTGNNSITAPNMDTNRFRMNGNIQNCKSLSQRVYINGKSGLEYTFGGWAYCENALPNQIESERALSITITTEGNNNVPIVLGTLDYNTSSALWQFLESSFVLESDTPYVDIHLNYNFQSGTAYFDGIQLNQDPLMSIGFNGDGALVPGYEFPNIDNETSDTEEPDTDLSDERYEIQYDQYGNILQNTRIQNDVAVDKEIFAYSSDGNYLINTTNSVGNTIQYNYNLNLGITDSVTDYRGNITNYSYNSMYLTGVSQAVTNGYFLNASLTIQNTFNYALGKLSQLISGNNVQYDFTYDIWGNISEIKVGEFPVVTYEYTTDSFRNLSKVIYANGLFVEYMYSDNNLGTDVYFGNGLQKTKVYTYAYDSNGQLISCTDWKNNILTKYKDKITEIWNLSTNTLLQSYGTVNENEKVKKLEKIGSSEFISEHFTDEGKRNISTFKSRQQSTNNFFELSKKSMEYDTFDRIITERYYIPAADTPILTKNYYYLNTENGETTTISGIDIITNNATTNFLYSYDANGNLSSVSKNGNLILRYEYDEIGQLIRYDHADSGHTYTYKYDAGGNLLHKRIFAFTTDDNVGIEQNYIAYNYSNTEWKDQLTSYNGKAITYDSIGNPLTFDGYTYTWEADRQLAAISGSGQTIVYKYNDNGIRTEKTVNGITTSYTIVDSKITSQKTGNSYIYFHYDSAGELVGMNYAGNEYFYLKDIAGNIIGIVNSSGTVVVQYTYDVWGNLISISGSMANTLGISNPFRYCGYYYDNESGMYYLQSRYYNPEWGRFINADDPSILLTGETGLFGNNLYSYCCNDSVNNIDFSGHVPRNNMNARQRYNANFNIIGNNPRSFQNFINGQGRYPYRNMPFGNYYTDYNGCGWIATYNALRYLCERPFLPNLIRSMEQSCTLLLNGLVGVPPWAVTSQLRLWGYNSKFITVASTKSRYWFLGNAKTIKDFQNTAKSVRAFIMLYRTSGGGAHYVFGRYVNSHKNFVFYNVYSKDSSYRTYFSLYGFVSSSQIVFMITL